MVAAKKPTTTKKEPVKKLTGLAGLRQSLTENYGDNRIVRRVHARKYDVVPTGSIALDHAMRTGGWPRGRLCELKGSPGMSKSSLAISSMREAQRAFPELAVGYIDMEHSWTFDWAEELGLNTDDDRLIYTKPRYSEDVSDQIREMMLSEEMSFIVVDSVGGMEGAKAMFEKEAGDSVMGKNAQIISRMCKQISVIADETNTGVLFINQMRANFNMGADQGSGPKILKYMTTIAVDLGRTSETVQIRKYEGSAIPVSTQYKAKVARNKLAKGSAGRTAEYWFSNVEHKDFGNRVGVDILDEAVVVGKTTGVLKPAGNWLTMPNGERFNGAKQAKAYLADKPDQVDEIRSLILSAVVGDLEEEVETEFVDDTSS